MRWLRENLLSRSMLLNIFFAAVVILFGAVFYSVGLEASDKISSVLGALMSVVALAFTLSSAREQKVARSRGVEEVLSELAGTLRAEWRQELAARERHFSIDLRAIWTSAHDGPADALGTALSGSSGTALVADSLLGSGHRRLVISGSAGSGKTTFAIRLLLELLDKRPSAGAVPVLLSIAGWDPQAEPFEDWLAEQLRLIYFGGKEKELVRSIVGRRQLIPILDGLDELPRQDMDQALRAIGEALAPTDPVVLVLRHDYSLGSRVRRRDPLSTADTVHLLPPTADEVAASLRASGLLGEDPGWGLLLAELDREPDGPLSRALSVPRNLHLLRRAYLDAARSPIDLLDRDRLPTESDIARHLLGSWVSVQTSETERRWLRTIARHLERAGTQVLTRRSPRWIRSMVGRMGWVVGVGMAIGAAAMAGLAVLGVPVQNVWGLVPVTAVAIGIVSPPVLGLWEEARWPGRTWALWVNAIGLSLLVGTFWDALISDGTLGSTPESGTEIGVGMAVASALSFANAQVVVLNTVAAWWLAARGRLPWRLHVFLERACEEDLLQRVGEGYRFSSRELHRLFAAVDLPVFPDEEAVPSAERTPPGPAIAVADPPESVPVDETLTVDDPVLEDPLAPVPGPPASVSAKIDAHAREEVLDELMNRPEILRRVDNGNPEKSRTKLRVLAASVLDRDPLAVESAAREQGERFEGALEAFRKAADLPFLSRFVRAYLWATWASGLVFLGLLLSGRRWSWTSEAMLVVAVVWLTAVLAWVSFREYVPQHRALRSRVPADWLQLDGLAHQRTGLDRTYKDWIRSLARDGLLPMVRERLGDEPVAYVTTLAGLSLEPLSPAEDREDQFVDTVDSRRLALLIEELSSASIGVSGPRGAGKSTLLRQLCAPDRHPPKDLRLLVHAPTAYDSREFLTYLFLRVCERILGDPGSRPAPARRARILAARTVPWATVAAGIALVGGTLYWKQVKELGAKMPESSTFYQLLGGFVLIALGLLGVLLVNRKPRLRHPTRSQNAAEGHLRRLRYQQAVTQTALGEVGIPGGSKVGAQSAVQRTEQVQSLPEIVADFRELLALLSADRRGAGNKVVIGIDELDKIATPEHAEKLLNDLKVVFGVPGCYFLVTVSEDALAAFGRRSLSIRSTYDSAFDTVVQVPPLRGAEALTLLSRRGIPLPAPYVWLCHALTGGLARDLLRLVLKLATVSAEHREAAAEQRALDGHPEEAAPPHELADRGGGGPRCARRARGGPPAAP
ncbi:hypothetical protein GCM10022221_45210 [Actinocorallia aurea]